MKYEDFEKFVRETCVYETIYDDSDGRQILVIQMLDAYGMVDKALRARLAQPERDWVGLTDKDIEDCLEMSIQGTCRAIEAKLKEKNGNKSICD